MYEYRQVIVRMRLGESDRAIARAGLMGRKYGFTGSYSSVRRFLQGVEAAHPQMTTVLEFEPGDVAQVDFGAGPVITDVHTGEEFKTWVFVMVLAWSRHQYDPFRSFRIW
jgi:transposase